MGARFFWDTNVRVEVVADPRLADQNPSFRGDEDGNGVGAGAYP
jgi:hypothetical protein